MRESRVIQRFDETFLQLVKSIPQGQPDKDSLRGDTADIARSLALLNAAMFDAANAIYRTDSTSDYANIIVATGAPPLRASAKVAAAAAGRLVLRSLFATRARRTLIDEAYDDSLAAIAPSEAQRRDGIAWGKAVAGEVIAERQFDVPAVSREAPTRDGGFNRRWRKQYSQLTPYCLDRPDQFLPAPPPASASPAYATGFDEVHNLGERVSAYRTPEQTAMARAWQGGAYTSRSPGAWFEMAIDLADARSLPTLDAARLFSLLGLALCDTMVATWNAKQTYDYWRPQDAIRQAHLDGNAETEQDLSWLQLCPSIGNTPDFPAGTAAFAGAAGTVLRAFFGTDAVSFTLNLQKDVPPELKGETTDARQYSSISEVVKEASMSPVFNGTHFPFSCRAGMKVGRQVAEHLLTQQDHPTT